MPDATAVGVSGARAATEVVGRLGAGLEREAGVRPAERGAWTRRGLLAWSGWVSMGLVGLQAAVAFLFYFWPRKIGTFGARMSAGRPEEYKVGDVRYFVEGKFYVTRLQEGFIALYQKCPHLGCTVPWKPAAEHEKAPGQKGLFVCPCHGSTYLPNGQVIWGPAPRALDYMPIQVLDGKLVVDTDPKRITRREKWDPRQALVV
jgi:cytochrome b6-f complex iron-sulfur subunit